MTPDEILARALQLHARGDFEAAGADYEAARQLAPGNGKIVTQLGLVRLQQGRVVEAQLLFDEALALDPAAAEPRAWKAEALRRLGHLEEAIAGFEAALALRADYAPAWFNLGLACASAKRIGDARRAWLEFLRLRPGDRRVRRELGVLAFDDQDYDTAAKWFGEQLALDEGNVDARCDLAATHLRTRQWTSARQLLERGATPGHFRSCLLLGEALAGERRFTDALAPLAAARALEPRNVDAAYELGLAHDGAANLVSAISNFNAALDIAPERADIMAALSVAELNLGNVGDAIAHHRRAVELDPASSSLHSALLMALHYAPVAPRAMLEEHLRWSIRHADIEPMARGAFSNAKERGRRLRIGYLSPRFGRGPLAHFFLPLLRAHDRAEVEVFCYMAADHRDAATGAMRELTDGWREVHRSSDDDLVQLIRGDRIDILVDVAGHCPGNRLGVFARRAAPVQISWLDYDDTTAVPAMDWYLSDAQLTPPDGPQEFTESLLFAGPVRAAYGSTTPVPEPGPLPQVARGYTTFGCINRISKLGPAVIAAWSRILTRVPASRLLLQAAAFASTEPQDVMRRRFAEHGIAPARLDLRPFSDEATMLRVYREIDIALDPFPYNGCNTTCDALSMGVPVVTLEGTTLSGRHGVALLSSCAMTAWIAHSIEEYVDLACNAARDPDALATLRSRLPGQFREASICDAVGFARGIERAYRDVWQAWCDAPDGA